MQPPLERRPHKLVEGHPSNLAQHRISIEIGMEPPSAQPVSEPAASELNDKSKVASSQEEDQPVAKKTRRPAKGASISSSSSPAVQSTELDLDVALLTTLIHNFAAIVGKATGYFKSSCRKLFDVWVALESPPPPPAFTNSAQSPNLHGDRRISLFSF